MGHERRHRESTRLARKLVSVVACRLRPKERLEAFSEFYDIVYRALTRHEVAARQRLLRPSRN